MNGFRHGRLSVVDVPQDTRRFKFGKHFSSRINTSGGGVGENLG